MKSVVHTEDLPHLEGRPGHARKGARPARFETAVRDILSPAGIFIDGDSPWDLHVNNKRFYPRVLREGSIGLGESYMDGWWECEELDAFFARLLPSDPRARIRKNWRLLLHVLGSTVLNPGKEPRAFEVGRRHYDKGNALFSRMLDKRMAYSCGYWKDSSTLDQAQEAKLELICRKLGLKAGDRVLDVGCGWGSFAKYAAEKYGASVVGISISKEQLALGKELCRGLPVELRLQDYRDVNGEFDHIVSVGMFEHVGLRNYRTYMTKLRDCLKTHGRFLLHTIGGNTSDLADDPWIDRYIFPNSFIPSLKQIAKSLEGLFVVEDVQNIGYHYDATLMAWSRNFDNNWPQLKDSYDERFRRMWRYYLLSCAGAFRSRWLQVWQLVLSKEGMPGGYDRAY